MDMNTAFDKFTKTKKTDTGYEVKCTKGLWGVHAPTKEEALNEARHYFMQYLYDGEYTA